MDTVHTITTLGPGREAGLVVPAKIGTMAPVGVFFEQTPGVDEQLGRMRNQWGDVRAHLGRHFAAGDIRCDC